MYCKMTADVRQCMDGKHHNSNRFYVQFQRSGNISYHCYAEACRKEAPIIGQWCTSLDDMLSSNMFVPCKTVDADLLSNLERLALEATPGKSKAAQQAAVSQQPWYPKLERTVCQYLSVFFVFISDPSVYVRQYLEDDSISHYKDYSADRLKNVVKPFKWAFDIWDASAYIEVYATKRKFGGSPWDDGLPADEYNRCQGAMPFLKLADQKPAEEDMKVIEPLLQHIRDCLCAGNEQNYQYFMAWVAHIAHHPDKKTG